MDDYIAGLVMPTARAEDAARAQARWNAVAKPIGALGQLETAIEQIAALTGDADVDLSRRCVVVLCSDNGVVAQGVSQSGPEVTAVVAHNLAQGTSSVCRMAEPFGIDTVPVDMGMREPLAPLETPELPDLLASAGTILDRRIGPGTADISQGPAMTRSQALAALRTGVELVGELALQGYRLVATGEMGIGNTTTATAVARALTGRPVAELVGRGAGLSDEGLIRKARAIEQALAINEPDPSDPVDVLAKLGGFDIAGLCGMCLGGAVHRVPVVLDGAISLVAALCARLLRADCAPALLASHRSSEPVGALMLEEMGLHPIIDAGMHLGEGTGAVCLVPLLDAALALYRGTTFADCGLEPYEELGSQS